MVNKKGFLASQALIFIFAAVILILIVIVGYSGIKNIKRSSDMSSLKIFEKRFSDDMEGLSIRKNSVSEFSYNVPSSYKKFCIFDTDNDTVFMSDIVKENPTIEAELKDETSNVFLIGEDNDYYFIRNENLRIKNYPFYHCFNIMNGKFSLSGKGTIVNGESSVQILVWNKAEITINKNVTEEVTLISTDDKFTLKIFPGTNITNNKIPGNEITLSITIGGVSELSDEYYFEPFNTTFNQNISLELKDKSCTSSSSGLYYVMKSLNGGNKTYYPKINTQGICTFSVNKFP